MGKLKGNLFWVLIALVLLAELCVYLLPFGGTVRAASARHASALSDLQGTQAKLERAREKGAAANKAMIEAALDRKAALEREYLRMILLLAPLARAAAIGGPREAALAAVLGGTTVEDARATYRAIRLAHPGGLGHAPDQDVAGEPTVTLQAAMALAADRDSVAGEYVTGFALTLGTGVPALRRARADGLGWADAVLETFLHLLAAAPDTHIARRAGPAAARDATAAARGALAAGGVRTADGRAAVAALDRRLRDPAHRLNPGTTADLTAAALFATILDGGWST